MADDGKSGGENWLQLLIHAIIEKVSFKEGSKKAIEEGVAEAAESGLTKAVNSVGTKNQKEFFSKLFPDLGLEMKDGKFTEPSIYGAGSKMMGGAADGMVKMLKTGLTILEDIYKKLVEASPLLQAVETLFNLAMQLFFMPLGNKLAEELIPAALEMIDDVMKMWDEMEKLDLDQILQKTMDKFAEVFIGFMVRVADQLKTHGGLLGAIGNLIGSIAGLAKTFLPLFIGFTANLITFIGQNFAWVVGAIVAFKIMHYTLMIAQIVATMGSSAPFGVGTVLGAGAVMAAIAGASAGGATAALGSHADGGYVASPQLALLGEGGEGEWVIPDSKVSDFITSQSAARNLKVNNINGSGNGQYTINVYGYTDRELSGIIEDKVNELSNRSRLRSGY